MENAQVEKERGAFVGVQEALDAPEVAETAVPGPREDEAVLETTLDFGPELASMRLVE